MSFLNRSALLGKVALAITAGVVLHAQEVTGNLLGSVKDDKGAAVAGAKVIIRAPQLIQPRTVLTESNGTFRAPLLPPGDYTIDVVKDGYKGQRSTNVRIGVGSNIRQDFVIRAVQVATAVVEVVASSATMDKTDTKAATSLSSETLLELPTSGGDRSFTGAMDLAPGVVTNSGGGTSIRGGMTQETGYTLNGTSIKDDYEGRMNTTRLIDDAVEDTQVIQSPLHARFGRTGGGMVNVVTKSGGNDFAGSIRTYVTRGDWSAKAHNQNSDTSDGFFDGVSLRQYDIFFSGPVVKDRLWFAISTIQKPSEGYSSTILIGEHPENWFPATQTGLFWGETDGNNPLPVPTGGRLYSFNLGTSVYGKHTQDFFDTKLTLAVTPDHTLDFTFQQNKQTYTNENPYGTPIVATIGSHSYNYDEVDKYYSYGYRGTFGSSLFLEARYSKTTAHVLFPAPPLDHIRLQYYGTQGNPPNPIFPYGFNLSPAPDQRDNQSGNLNVKKFLEAGGTHELDFGFDFYEFLRGTQTQNGALNRRFYAPAVVAISDLPNGTVPNATPDPYGNMVAFQAVNYQDTQSASGDEWAPASAIMQSPVMRRYFGRDGVSKTRNTGLYANDSWVVNSNINVMFGLRIDKFKVVDTDGSVLVNRQGPIAPRFQFRYDFDGTSKHVVTFTAAKYVEEIGAGFADAFIKKANSAYANYAWTAPTAWVDYAAFTNAANYNYAYLFFDSSKNNVLKGLSNPYVMEYTLGYRRNYTNGSSFQIQLIHKDWKNMFTIGSELDLAHVVDVADVTGTGLASKKALTTWFFNSDMVKRTYNAVELDFHHTISSTWLFGGNYTWSRLVGNGNGGDNGSQGFFDTALSAPAAYPVTMANAGIGVSQYAPTGLLLSNQTHKGRLYVTATLPMGKGRISYSALLRYDSGNSFGASESAKMPAPVQTLPVGTPLPKTYTYWGTQRGVFNYNDTYQVDAKINWSLPLVGKLQLMGDFQVDNVFNNMQQTSYSTGWSPSILGTNPTSQIKVASPATFGTDNGDYAYWNAARSVRASIGLKF